jgi:hypothetical protein
MTKPLTDYGDNFAFFSLVIWFKMKEILNEYEHYAPFD